MPRHRLIILWFPLWILILTLMNGFAPDSAHSMTISIFQVTSIIFFTASFQDIRKMLAKAEFRIAVGSVGFALIILEIALRLIPSPISELAASFDIVIDTSRWQISSGSYAFTMRPNWENDEGDRINSFGYRGLEIEVPKPEGVFRVLAIGGSTTYDTGVEHWQDAYPAQLERLLHDEYGYSHIEVINGGQIAYNSWENLINLVFRGVDLEPDLVIYYEATNEAQTLIVPPANFRGDNSGRRHPWDSEQESLSEQWALAVPSIVWRLVGLSTGLIQLPSKDLESYTSQPCTGFTATTECLGITPLEAVQTNSPIYYERNLLSMAAIARAHGSEIMFVTWAYTDVYGDYPSREEYVYAYEVLNDSMKSVAAAMDIPVYDLAAVMPTDIQYWVDGRHMSADGNRFRAEVLAEFLVSENIIPAP